MENWVRSMAANFLLVDKTSLEEKHKIYPCVSREIIYKDDIVAMSSFWGKGTWTPKHQNEQDQKDDETQSRYEDNVT